MRSRIILFLAMTAAATLIAVFCAVVLWTTAAFAEAATAAAVPIPPPVSADLLTPPSAPPSGVFDTQAETSTRERSGSEKESHRNWYLNVSTNGLMDANGNWSADVEIPLARWLTVSGSYLYYTGQENQSVTATGFGQTMTDSTTKAVSGAAIGARVNFFLEGDRGKSGPLLALSLLTVPNATFMYQENGVSYSGTYTDSLVIPMGSYRWMFWGASRFKGFSAFNLTVGLGLILLRGPGAIHVTSASGSSLDVTPIKPLGGLMSFVPTADANLGFSF